MISLDQVMLLEQKVESAVAKIQQLQAENDALRSKCSELTNALSSKSEQLSSFETDQSQIESGILKALDRLNQIENSVLKAGGQAASTPKLNVQPSAQVIPQTEPAQPQIPVSEPVHTTIQTPVIENNSTPVQTQAQGVNFFSMNEAPAPEAVEESFSEEITEEENPDNLGFDIF